MWVKCVKKHFLINWNLYLELKQGQRKYSTDGNETLGNWWEYSEFSEEVWVLKPKSGTPLLFKKQERGN